MKGKGKLEIKCEDRKYGRSGKCSVGKWDGGEGEMRNKSFGWAVKGKEGEAGNKL